MSDETSAERVVEAGQAAPATQVDEAAASITPRDAGNWAAKVDRLSVADEVSGFGYNVAGRRVAGPHQGFGRLWQRTYSVDLGSAVGPQELVADWRAHFGDFWPKGGVFHGALTGIEPGAVAPLEVGGGRGPKLATGVLVLYADDESFTFMTPEGHMFASMITFSGEEADGATTARIRILLRTSDPLFELGWPIMKRAEDTFWSGTLRNLAASHGVDDVHVQEESECLDRQRLWKNWRNVWHNAGIRSAWHIVTAPFRSQKSATGA